MRGGKVCVKWKKTHEVRVTRLWCRWHEVDDNYSNLLDGGLTAEILVA